jgi:serine/threonine protein kinase
VPLPEEGVLSTELQDFILHCMRKDPFRRPTAEGLLSHEYILKVCCSSLQRVT